MHKGVQQFIDELKQPPAQLELFKDSEREFYRKLMISILEHSDEIHRMHKLMIEVLGEDYDKKKPTASEVGYPKKKAAARKPRPMNASRSQR